MSLSKDFVEIQRLLLRGQKMIWWGFLLIVIFIVIFSYWLLETGLLEHKIDVSNLRFPMNSIYYGVSGIVVIVSLVFNRLMFGDAKIKKELSKKHRIEKIAFYSRTKTVDQDLLRKINALSDDEKKLVGILRWHIFPFIFALLFNEILTLVGGGVSLISSDLAFVISAAVVNVALNLILLKNCHGLVERGRHIQQHTH